MSTSEPQTNNIVLKLHYYKTTDQYPKGDENIAHREFVSCKDSYSYLNYVDTGATEQTDLYFVDFLNGYLQVKKQQVEPITHNAYTKQATQFHIILRICDLN